MKFLSYTKTQDEKILIDYKSIQKMAKICLKKKKSIWPKPGHVEIK